MTNRDRHKSYLKSTNATLERKSICSVWGAGLSAAFLLSQPPPYTTEFSARVSSTWTIPTWDLFIEAIKIQFLWEKCLYSRRIWEPWDNSQPQQCIHWRGWCDDPRCTLLQGCLSHQSSGSQCGFPPVSYICQELCFTNVVVLINAHNNGSLQRHCCCQ